MIGEKSVLAVIPARGGSKGVPRKNIRNLGGRPLIAWTIEAARASQHIDRTILSTEDSEIATVAQQWGCEIPFIRPADLARDETPGIDPVMHALRTITETYDCVVMLQPTSPLRTAADIDGCIERCVTLKAPAGVSVAEPDKNPYWMYTLGTDGRMRPLLEVNTYLRRQDLPKVYALNGAVYVADCRWLERTRTFVTNETIAYLMPRERSLDIDSELDLKICELLLSASPPPGGAI